MSVDRLDVAGSWEETVEVGNLRQRRSVGMGLVSLSFHRTLRRLVQIQHPISDPASARRGFRVSHSQDDSWKIIGKLDDMFFLLFPFPRRAVAQCRGLNASSLRGILGV